MADNTQQALQQARQTIIDLRTVLDPFDGPAKVVWATSAHTLQAIDAALDGIAGDAAPQEQPLPAWQDVLGEAEQLVKQKPIFARYIKGTILENDVPVWIADFAQRAVQRERARATSPLTIPQEAS